MQSLAKSMAKIMDRILKETDVPCPECGNMMLAYRNDPVDAPRCPPTCIGCGYKSNNKKLAIKTEIMYEQAIKTETIRTLRMSSITSDKSVFGKNMDNFKADTKERLTARQIAYESINRIMQDKTTHTVFSGGAGRGKTHLAMAIVDEVMKQSNYKKKALFISYPDFLEEMKKAMGDKDMQRTIMNQVELEIKAVDVLVLDDLGAELGRIGSDTLATDYSLKQLFMIANARAEKNLVITTNLSSKDIKRVYDDRVYSRLLSNLTAETAFQFVETKDGRMAI